MLDSPNRRGPKGSQYRRALVHDPVDGLSVNWANDYPGGVQLNGVREIRLQPTAGGGLAARLGVPTLVVKGGISFQQQIMALDRGAPKVGTFDLATELGKLGSRIADLEARLSALENR